MIESIAENPIAINLFEELCFIHETTFHFRVKSVTLNLALIHLTRQN
jgi:hypothetical protein